MTRLSQLFSVAISLVLLATMAVGCAEPSPTSTPTPVPTELEAVTFPDENLDSLLGVRHSAQLLDYRAVFPSELPQEV